MPSTSAGQPSGGDPDAGGLGALSRAFLRPAPYTGVAVQADVAGDANPPPVVLSRLTSVLGRETTKAVRIAARRQLAGKPSACWTDDDIARTTSASRTVHTGGSTVALYVLFLDGTSCTDATTLGEAYGASSMLVFVDVTEQAAPLTIDPALYVEAVTTHELGHILGLVNIGYQSRIAHEDPGHPHHSSDPQSVMYWKIDRGNVIQQLLNGPPQDFDQADAADLAGLRDGTY